MIEEILGETPAGNFGKPALKFIAENSAEIARQVLDKSREPFREVLGTTLR